MSGSVDFDQAQPMEIENERTLSSERHRMSVQRKKWPDPASRRKMQDMERRVSRTTSRYIQRGSTRESGLFQALQQSSSTTIHDIDSASIRVLVARASDIDANAAASAHIEGRIRQEISRYRRNALETICGNQRIRDLCQSLYSQNLPTQEQLSRFSDEEIANLVYNLALVTLQWDALDVAFKTSVGDISPSSIFDNPENLEKILEALHSYNQLKASYRQELDSEMARLARLKITVSPRLHPAYERIEGEIQTLRTFSPTDVAEESRFLAEFPSRLRAIHERVDGFDAAIVKDLADDLNVKPEVAEEIFRGALSNWKGFITVMDDGLVKQTHSIKGLKIYFLPGTNILVADFAGKVIGTGTYKRVKSEARIGGSSDPLSEVVRLTSRAKGLTAAPSEEEKKWAERQVGKFAKDVLQEFHARQVLDGVPNIAEMTVIKYYNRKGELKTRYFMTRYESDLGQMIEEGGGANALRCCGGVVRALKGIHRLGWVHGDLKAQNILTSGAEGYVADFGFFNRDNTPCPFVGNLVYWAPETVFGRNRVYDLKTDMFSLGILLLYAVNPGLYRQWFLDIEALDAFVQGKQNALDREMDRLNKELQTLSSVEARIQGLPETAQKKQKLQSLQEQQRKLIVAQQEIKVRWANLQAEYKTRYAELHKRLREQVQREANPHCLLIADLLSYKPEDRPTAEQAEARFVSVPA